MDGRAAKDNEQQREIKGKGRERQRLKRNSERKGRMKDDEVKVVVDVHHQRGREPG